MYVQYHSSYAAISAIRRPYLLRPLDSSRPFLVKSRLRTGGREPPISIVSWTLTFFIMFKVTLNKKNMLHFQCWHLLKTGDLFDVLAYGHLFDVLSQSCLNLALLLIDRPHQWCLSAGDSNIAVARIY